MKYAAVILLILFTTNQAWAVTAQFTSPAANEVIPLGQAVEVTINVSGLSGASVDRINLTINGDFIRNDKQSPYYWGQNSGESNDDVLADLAVGTYTLEATVVTSDRERLVITQSFQIEEENTSNPPSVSFTQPSALDRFEEGDSLVVEARAEGQGDNHINRVELHFDDELVGKDRRSPYQWTGITDLEAGNHTLELVAVDNEGQKTSTVMTIEVQATTALACNKSENRSDVEKPRGVFTSTITSGSIDHAQVKGGLIRIAWADLQPTRNGDLAFREIERRKDMLGRNQKWTLAIHGGWTSLDESDPDYRNSNRKPALHMSPEWLETDALAETFEMEFRQITVKMPKYWNDVVQAELKNMIEKVAARYADDPDLQMIYVPQMTSNGVEGHFNGVDHDILLDAAGISSSARNAEQQFEAIWVDAALQASLSVAEAFPNKAVAFEVHEILDRIHAPQQIMNAFLQDPAFEDRVGIAMWWISGDETYQPDLIEVIQNYQGDLYGQVIGESTEPNRFENGYAGVFAQAKQLCMRYIEPWNYEFENNTFDQEMADFNLFADQSFE